MRKVVAFLATAVVAFILYVILTMWSGGLGLWSLEEFVTGSVFALVTALVVANILFESESYRMLNPIRLVLFFIYIIGPFFWAMAKANIDVAYRVITGRINPGIVKIKPNLRTDLGLTMLANSITLTPGTLSVDVDEETKDLYVHWINVTNKEPTPEEVCDGFPKWARRVAG